MVRAASSTELSRWNPTAPLEKNCDWYTEFTVLSHAQRINDCPHGQQNQRYHRDIADRWVGFVAPEAEFPT